MLIRALIFLGPPRDLLIGRDMCMLALPVPLYHRSRRAGLKVLCAGKAAVQSENHYEPSNYYPDKQAQFLS